LPRDWQVAISWAMNWQFARLVPGKVGLSVGLQVLDIYMCDQKCLQLVIKMKEEVLTDLKKR